MKLLNFANMCEILFNNSLNLSRTHHCVVLKYGVLFVAIVALPQSFMH